jgi:hypothetical protein
MYGLFRKITPIYGVFFLNWVLPPSSTLGGINGWIKKERILALPILPT